MAKLTGAEKKKAQSAEGKLTAALKAAAKQAETLETKRGTNKNTAQEGGEGKYSIKRTPKMTLSEQLKMYYDGKMASSDAFYFGETPAVLEKAGMDTLPLAFTQADFKKTTKNKHNVPRHVLKNLRNDLETALFAFGSGDRIGILTGDIDGDGKPLLVGIQTAVQMDAGKVNAIRSAYGLDNPGAWVKNQIESGKTFTLIDEKRANTFLYPYGYSASRKEGISSTGESVTQNDTEVKTKYSLKADERKQAQLEVILKSNPAEDDYHTWIRDVEDIHTFREVLNDSEWIDYDEFDPDYTKAMAEQALNSGKIEVFSSHPIRTGIFVTPSRIEAESYAGNGRVYSETVNIDDVAWIDPTQGQFAPVEQTRFSLKNVDGKQVVWLENSSLTNKELNNYHAVADFIAQHIGEFYTIVESGQKVFIGEDLPGEYTHSKYTSYLRKTDRAGFRAKRKAVDGLGELIETATNRRWEKTKHPQSKDAKYGIYRYDASFAFPVKDTNGTVQRVRAYDAEILIRNASDGKKYLYDIVNIKENTADAIDLMKREARLAAYQKTASHDDVSDDSISAEKEDVNGKYSLKAGTESKSTAELRKRNRELEEQLTYWRGQVQRTKMPTTNRADVAKTARELLRDTGARMDALCNVQKVNPYSPCTVNLV